MNILAELLSSKIWAEIFLMLFGTSDNTLHLCDTSDEILYLDIIHELCHVKQHLQGRDLYDRSKAYVDRETEIEAYEITVREARRIGLTDDAILNYLRVSWITPEEHKRLAPRLEVNGSTVTDR